ncbi:hypothetical protein [Streptomyces smyrnaeus]|uniref:hypothetical protein n=1 Tax=Streptomyces smyrnaeus TaxID=1387713 RepID=UPI0033CC24C7
MAAPSHVRALIAASRLRGPDHHQARPRLSYLSFALRSDALRPKVAMGRDDDAIRVRQREDIEQPHERRRSDFDGRFPLREESAQSQLVLSAVFGK